MKSMGTVLTNSETGITGRTGRLPTYTGKKGGIYTQGIPQGT